MFFFDGKRKLKPDIPLQQRVDMEIRKAERKQRRQRREARKTRQNNTKEGAVNKALRYSTGNSAGLADSLVVSPVKMSTSASSDSLLLRGNVVEPQESREKVEIAKPKQEDPKPVLPTEPEKQFMNELEKWQYGLEKEEKILQEKFLKAQKREELLEDWTKKMDAFEKKFFSSLSEDKHIQDFSNQLEEHQKEIENFKTQFKLKADKKEKYWSLPVNEVHGEYQTYDVKSHKQKIKELYLAHRELPPTLPFQAPRPYDIPSDPILPQKQLIANSSDEDSSEDYKFFEDNDWENDDIPEND